MIYIISGPINTGKTSWLLQDFKKYPDSDGFACRKVRENGEHIGYELVHLKSGETCQFIRKIEHIPENWNEGFRLGCHYSFNCEGLSFADKIAENALSNGIQRFYLDEVAHLELRGEGFSEILKKLVAAKIDLVLVVREALVEKLTQAYGISAYKVITPVFDK